MTGSSACLTRSVIAENPRTAPRRVLSLLLICRTSAARCSLRPAGARAWQDRRLPTSRPDPRHRYCNSEPAANRHLSGWGINHDNGFTAFPQCAHAYPFPRWFSHLNGRRVCERASLRRRGLFQMPGARISARKPLIRDLPVGSAEAADQFRGSARLDHRLNCGATFSPAIRGIEVTQPSSLLHRWNAFRLTAFRLQTGTCSFGGKTMNWLQVADAWRESKASVQRKWVKLTDDDLELIDGRRDRLERKILQLYGFAPDHVRKEVDDWVRWQRLARSRSRKAQLRSALATR